MNKQVGKKNLMSSTMVELKFCKEKQSQALLTQRFQYETILPLLQIAIWVKLKQHVTEAQWRHQNHSFAENAGGSNSTKSMSV